MTDLTFTEVDCEQGTPEWFEARSGLITASMIKVIRKTLENGEYSAPAKSYAFQLAYERAAQGVMDDTYINGYMRRGHDYEVIARELHEGEIGNKEIKKCGIFRSDCGRFGASPDGLIGNDGGAEYKCFTAVNELMPIIMDNDISTVIDQVQFNIYATGRKWWHFMLYTPQASRVTDKPFKIFTIERDEKYITEMVQDLLAFDEYVSTLIPIVLDFYGANDSQEPELDLTQKDDDQEENFEFDF